MSLGILSLGKFSTCNIPPNFQEKGVFFNPISKKDHSSSSYANGGRFKKLAQDQKKTKAKPKGPG